MSRTAKLTNREVEKWGPEKCMYRVYDADLTGFVLRVQPTGSKTYFYEYRNQAGSNKSYCIGRHGKITANHARDEAKKCAAQVTLGVDIQAVKTQKRNLAQRAKIQTLGGFIDLKYGPWVTESRKTGQETLRRLQVQFGHLYPRPMNDITPWIIEKWRSEQFKKGKKKATANRDITALKAVMSKAVEWGVVEHHPLEKVKPLKVDGRGSVRFLVPEEESRLRETIDKREANLKLGRERGNEHRRIRGYEELPSLIGCAFADRLKPMVLLSLNTGLRRGELFDLTWACVGFRNKTLCVAGHTAKSGETRHLPLNSEALSVLEAWREQSNRPGLVFPGKNGYRMNNVSTSWKKLITAAEIENFRWHDLRHHFASRLVMAGVPLNTVRELLGHSDMKMTLRYAHLAPDHKAEAVERLTSIA